MSTEATPANVGSNAGLGPLVKNAHNDEPAYSSNQVAAIVAAAVAAERERCAMQLQVTRADVSLAAGELSTEEWRMCAAVLRWMQGRIRGA